MTKHKTTLLGTLDAHHVLWGQIEETPKMVQPNPTFPSGRKGRLQSIWHTGHPLGHAVTELRQVPPFVARRRHTACACYDLAGLLCARITNSTALLLVGKIGLKFCTIDRTEPESRRQILSGRCVENARISRSLREPLSTFLSDTFHHENCLGMRETQIVSHGFRPRSPRRAGPTARLMSLIRCTTLNRSLTRMALPQMLPRHS